MDSNEAIKTFMKFVIAITVILSCVGAYYKLRPTEAPYQSLDN